MQKTVSFYSDWRKNNTHFLSETKRLLEYMICKIPQQLSFRTETFHIWAKWHNSNGSHMKAWWQSYWGRCYDLFLSRLDCNILSWWNQICITLLVMYRFHTYSLKPLRSRHQKLFDCYLNYLEAAAPLWVPVCYFIEYTMLTSPFSYGVVILEGKGHCVRIRWCIWNKERQDRCMIWKS